MRICIPNVGFYRKVGVAETKKIAPKCFGKGFFCRKNERFFGYENLNMKRSEWLEKEAQEPPLVLRTSEKNSLAAAVLGNKVQENAYPE